MEKIIVKDKEKKEKHLYSYRRIKGQIERLEYKIQEIRLDKMCPSVVQSDTTGGGSGMNDLSGYMARLDDLERKYIAAKKIKTELCEQIEKEIDSMPDDKNGMRKKVLFEYFIKSKSMQVIADENSYSKMQIYRIYLRALQDFEILEE